ncbi:MAG: GNAT family N-acetyltransferase [Pseudomonadota bacterium]|nr:GNAT family N-acetyltransferase [Pseudomonadota bacterium]
MSNKFNRYLCCKSLSSEELATFHSLCFKNAENTFSKKSMYQFLNNSNYRILYSKFCLGITQVALTEAEILTVAVLPAYQNQGIGKTLVNDILLDLSSHGIEKVFLEVASNNITAISIYNSYGFKSCRTRKNYYRTENLDAIQMSTSLQ